MTALNDVLATPIMQTLGWTLVHFLWQGTLVALGFAALLYISRGSSSPLRYAVSCIGLALMVLAPIATFIYLAPSVKPVYNFVETPEETATPSIPTPVTTPSEDSQNIAASNGSSPPPSPQKRYGLFSAKSFKAYLPLLVSLWLLGVMMLSVRLLGGLWLAHKLRTRGIKPVSDMLESTLHSLISKLGITKAVRLRESLVVNVPVVIGWLRPVVLLPTSVITGLSVKQLELILTHELAHIRRNDYLVNVVQKIAETLLFYHPAIWWLSGVIRQERENCCDDIALRVCEGDKLTYAKTLARLESLRPPTQLALAASGGSLLKRIQRLAGKPTEVSNPVQWLVVTCLALLPWLILSVATAQASLPKAIEDNIDAFVEERLKIWNLPGLQMAVVKDGEIAFNKAFGLADAENNIPMTVDTPIPVGALSRAFTVIAILQLVEEGKLSLDSTLAEYLPWVKLPGDYQNTVTLKELLAPQGSGFTSESEKDIYCSSDCEEVLTLDYASREAYIQSLMPDEIALDTFADARNRARLTAILLALILEKVTATSFEDYMQANVFEPMGLNTSYDLEEAKQRGLAMGYNAPYSTSEEPPQARPYQMSSILNPYMGVIMSSRDVATFLAAMLGNEPKIFTAEKWRSLLSYSSEIMLFNGLNTFEFTPFDKTKDLVLFSNFNNRWLVFNIFPEENRAHFTMGNFHTSNTAHTIGFDMPLVVSTSILLGETEVIISEKTYPNPNSSAIRRAVGKFSSPLGVVELFVVGEELHGRMMGHDFKVEDVIGSMVIRSDYEPINGVTLGVSGDDIALKDWIFGYRIEDSE